MRPINDEMGRDASITTTNRGLRNANEVTFQVQTQLTVTQNVP